MKLELRAAPEEVMRAVEAMQDYARARGVPEKMIFGLALALEESGSNIVNHALQRNEQKTFHVAVQTKNDQFVIELRDDGPPFDPTAAAERKPQAEEDDLPGGWGIQLIRRYTDAVDYTREGGENVLRLTKKMLPESPAK